MGSPTETRTLVFRVRAEYPNQLDYRGWSIRACTKTQIMNKPPLRVDGSQRCTRNHRRGAESPQYGLAAVLARCTWSITLRVWLRSLTPSICLTAFSAEAGVSNWNDAVRGTDDDE